LSAEGSTTSLSIAVATAGGDAAPCTPQLPVRIFSKGGLLHLLALLLLLL
jgi:hypothetical protein